jgi:alpha-beta hydrolase superfamily lysophospholipase
VTSSCSRGPIAIDSVPTEGVRTLPASRIRATFPVLHNPANRHRAVAFTPSQFHYAFTNTLSELDSAAAYERYHIPAPGRWVWDGVLANVRPGHQATWVNYRNDDRAPLLFLAGGKDNIMPAAVNKQNAQRYEKSAAHTDYYEFAGRDHYTIGAPDWEKVADYARTWATTTHPGAGGSSPGAGPRRPDLLSEVGRQPGDAGRVAPAWVARRPPLDGRGAKG